MCHYTHFTTEERELSRVWKTQGLSIRAIARMLKRSPSSVSREFARNSREDGTCSANYADKQYAERRKSCGRKPILENEQVKKYVVEKLEQRWTPELIAGRAKLEKQPFSFSYPTIYRAIDKGILPKQLKKNMRFKWKHKKCARVRINAAKSPILCRFTSVPRVQKTVPVSVIGKATLFSAKEVQAV